jgi:hypothetical protein
MAASEAELAALVRQVRDNPRSIAFVALAEALRRAGRPHDALATLREGERHRPDFGPARVVLARTHLDLGHREMAIDVLAEVARSDAEKSMITIELVHGAATRRVSVVEAEGAPLGMPRWHASMEWADGDAGVTHHGLTLSGEYLLDLFYVDTQVKMDAHQLSRMEAQFQNSTARWKMAVGHNGIFSYGSAHWCTKALAPLDAIMRRNGMHAYLNGHDHDLMVIRQPASFMDGPLYVTSGAGSSTRNDVRDPSGDGSLVFSYGFSGFAGVSLTEDEATFAFYDVDGALLDTVVKAWSGLPTCPTGTKADADPRCYSPPMPKKAVNPGMALRTAALDFLEEKLGVFKYD